MPITLSELLALREDKQTLARIDDLLARRKKAEAAIEQARKEIAEVDGEFAKLGIEVEAAEPEPGDAPPKPRRPRSPAKPVASTEQRRGTDEYVDALDALGREFGHLGRNDLTGPEIVKAMASRGFPSKQGVMRAVKEHERWTMSGSRRGTRYRYHAEGRKRTRSTT